MDLMSCRNGVRKASSHEGALFCLAFNSLALWPLSTRRALSRPRLAYPLYVWKIMQVNDRRRGAASRASAGRARPSRSFLRSFTFRQILSLLGEEPLRRLFRKMATKNRGHLLLLEECCKLSDSKNTIPYQIYI